MNTRLAGAALAAAALFLPPSPASSSQLLGPATTSVTIGGATFAAFRSQTGADDSVPWTAEVFSEQNQCLRLSVTSAVGQDLEMTVVGPNGKVYRDDQGNGNNNPLIKINGADNKGYYSVRLNNWLGQPVDGTFTFKAERLPKNFATCLPGSVSLTNGP